jgi:hypothetical protein
VKAAPAATSARDQRPTSTPALGFSTDQHQAASANSLAASQTYSVTVVGPAEVEATDDTANMVLMNIWRGNESYFRSWDTSGSSIGSASSSWRGSYYVADLPGSGNILTMSVFPGPGWLLQAFWRDGGSSGTADDVGYFRYIPLSSSGAIEWQNADTTWSGPMGYVGIPGTGSIQAQGDIMVGTVVYQTAWRNNEGWVRTVVVSNTDRTRPISANT